MKHKNKQIKEMMLKYEKEREQQTIEAEIEKEISEILEMREIPNRHYAKPWKDPESLFCSPKLKEIINKEPLSGKECKN